jgi:hypothetical protein
LCFLRFASLLFLSLYYRRIRYDTATENDGNTEKEKEEKRSEENTNLDTGSGEIENVRYDIMTTGISKAIEAW